LGIDAYPGRRTSNARTKEELVRARIALLGATAVLVSGSLAASAMGSAAATPKLSGTVGPGFTITLKSKGAAVKTLKAGKYSITVSDKSPIHNFHLSGPGLNKEITTVSFTGTKTVTVTLKKGKYTFVCDPHASSMKGSFTVS
jgi:plastocyanin